MLGLKLNHVSKRGHCCNSHNQAENTLKIYEWNYTPKTKRSNHNHSTFRRLTKSITAGDRWIPLIKCQWHRMPTVYQDMLLTHCDLSTMMIFHNTFPDASWENMIVLSIKFHSSMSLPCTFSICMVVHLGKMQQQLLWGFAYKNRYFSGSYHMEYLNI